MKYREIFELHESELRPATVPGILRQISATEPCFSRSDCVALDAKVRGKTTIKKLTPEELKRLRLSLDDIAARFHRAKGWSKNATPLQQRAKAEKIKNLCGRILKEMGIDRSSNPDEFGLNLVDRCGIFYNSPDLHVGKLISALQITEEQAASAIADFDKEIRSDDPPLNRGRQLDLRELWLYESLSQQYRSYWGAGSIPVSRSNNEGGPSVRYFQFVVKKIVGRRPTMDAVHDYLRKYLTLSDASAIRF